MIAFCYSLAFFSLVFLSLLCVFGALGAWYTLFIGVAVLAALFFTQKRKKIFYSLLALFIVLALALVAFLWRDLSTGGKILANALFEKSEAAQNYRYRYFAVPVVRKLYPRYIALFGGVSALPLGVLFYFLDKDKSGLGYSAVFLLLILFFVYFGVFANGVLIALFALCLISYFLLPKLLLDKRGALAVSAFLLVFVSVCSLGLFYQPNERVTSFSEKVRDLFDEISFSGEGEGGSPSSDQGGEGESGESGSEMATTVRRTPVLLLVFGGVALLVLAVPALGIVKKQREKRKQKKAFSSADPVLSVKAYFLASVGLLQKKGFSFRNKGYRNYAEELSSRFGPSYGELFTRAVTRYEEALYSTHLGTERAREEVKTFYLATKSLPAKGGKR